MKIKIGKYVQWWSTTRTDQKWCEYRGLNKNGAEETKLDKAVFKALDIWQVVLNHTLNKFGEWKGRKVSVQIDEWDTWSMDHTLALIIPAMLKQLKETKNGAPLVANKDVPKALRYDEDKLDGDIDEHWFARWDYVLDEMIWAFEWKANEDWEEDAEIRDAQEKRAAKGYKLFGKYYQALWD